MRRLFLLPLLLAAAPVFAQPHLDLPRGINLPSFRASSSATAAAYTCTAAQAGPNGRCASIALPGDLKADKAPQFMLITFDDCVTNESEANVRSLLTSAVKNPDGRPIPVTYFVSLEGCPRGVSSDALLQQRYRAGDEMAVHTRTHTTSSTTSLSTWLSEIQFVQNHFKKLGFSADAGRGFRAPYLATNPAMYQALDSLNLLYDSSIYESPFWSPVSVDTKKFIWPFTYDVWNPAKQAQFCAEWSEDNACPSRPAQGLWQIPLYYYVGGTEKKNPTFYGVMDVGHPDYAGYSPALTGNTLLSVLRSHRNDRLSGNRAPMTLFFHADGFSEAARRDTYRTFLTETLARKDVWAITMQGLLEWMKAPVPESGMKAWYEAYCQRHPCAAPGGSGTTVAGSQAPTDATRTLALDGASFEADLRVYPSPTRGPLHIEATATTASAFVTVHDMLGREVRRQPLDRAGASVTGFDLGNLAAGVYLVRLSDGPQTITRTIVVQP